MTRLRDSGIWWVGAIPSHWSVEPVRSRFVVQLGKMVDARRADGTEVRPYLRNANVRWDEFELSDVAEMTFTERECAEYELVPGDLLVCEGGEVGRAAIWNGEIPGCTYQKALHRLRRTRSVEPRFFLYALRAAADAGVFEAEGNQSTFMHLTAEKLRAHRFAWPPVPEQQAISGWLDSQTRQLAQLIEQKQRLRELLDERRLAVTLLEVTGAGLANKKASSIHWTGPLPSHWAQVKVGSVATLGSGHTPSRDHPEWWVDCTIPWVTTGEVAQMRSDRIEEITETREMISDLGLANSSATLRPKGTVVLCRTAASAGYSAIMGKEMTTSQDFATWTCGPLLRPRYLLLCLRAMRRDLLGRLAMGSTHKTIYMPDIEALRIPLPPIDEQDEIVERTWRQLRAIDETVDAIEQHVGLLQERKRTLIKAAVTGHLDVAREITAEAS